MYALGLDLGSSSLKAALVHVETGETLMTDHYPKKEMGMVAHYPGWAEQSPETWWHAAVKTITNLLKYTQLDPNKIVSIGIAYQMHGLVLIDKDQNVLRPSIIWCDSRAVDIGHQALTALGAEYCFQHLLNSPGNFTASKLKWVKDHEPELYNRAKYAMLPGDYLVMKLTGEVNTTVSGLSEGIFWDFKNSQPAIRLLDYYGLSADILPPITKTFGIQGILSGNAAQQLGLKAGTPITYRAGDQPNNALSLRVFQPGEVAATGGTSGVVYGITDSLVSDQQSRINAFAHVNHTKASPRIGQLLCINGAGSQYAWIKHQVALEGWGYEKMEHSLSDIPIGSEGLTILPFGNGAERMLNNQLTNAQISHLNFHIHGRTHLIRAALEGIAFSFVYGMQIMANLGLSPSAIRVGNDNLFQSTVFSKTIATLTNCRIEVFDTTGAIGAAKASTIGIGLYNTPEEAIASTKPESIIGPDDDPTPYQKAYKHWTSDLINLTKNDRS